MRLLVAASATLLLSLPAPAAAPAPDKKDRVKMDEPTKQAVNKALQWLKENQRPDGSWGRTALTGFALLAFMSNGNVPNQGLYAPEVAKGVRNLLSKADVSGYLAAGGGNMYDHGMATLALTQVYGMTQDEEVKKVTTRAINLLIKTQNSEGGWRYDPAPTGADISVTIMAVMALRGAKDSGMHVPDDVMRKALAYINRCHDARSGGYRYQPYSSGPGYARTAAGVCVLQLCGEYEAKQINAAVEFMEKTVDDRQHYWYGHYYAAHAFNQVGGKIWEEYYDRMKKTLLAKQRPTGEWMDGREAGYGPAYQTAIAVLILSVPTHFLPIYQK